MRKEIKKISTYSFLLSCMNYKWYGFLYKKMLKRLINNQIEIIKKEQHQQ